MSKNWIVKNLSFDEEQFAVLKKVQKRFGSNTFSGAFRRLSFLAEDLELEALLSLEEASRETGRTQGAILNDAIAGILARGIPPVKPGRTSFIQRLQREREAIASNAKK